MQFIDLKQQYDLIKDKINESINNVINEANFIQGKEVKELEDNLRDYVGAKCIYANGTDALLIAFVHWVSKQEMKLLCLLSHGCRPLNKIVRCNPSLC